MTGPRAPSPSRHGDCKRRAIAAPLSLSRRVRVCPNRLNFQLASRLIVILSGSEGSRAVFRASIGPLPPRREPRRPLLVRGEASRERFSEHSRMGRIRMGSGGTPSLLLPRNKPRGRNFMDFARDDSTRYAARRSLDFGEEMPSRGKTERESASNSSCFLSLPSGGQRFRA